MQPILFIPSLWLLPSSWAAWMRLFDAAGFLCIVARWPDGPPGDPDETPLPPGMTVADVADHLQSTIAGLNSQPVLIGHCFGGLLAQLLAGRGLARATVAIAPAPFRGVVPLPHTRLHAAGADGTGTSDQAVPLTFEQFRGGFANALPEREARRLHGACSIAAQVRQKAGVTAFEVDPWAEEKVDTITPQRGPLLIIGASEDRIVPASSARASYHVQRRNAAPTEFVEMADRGHSLTVDQGWSEVADTALRFLRRHLGNAGPDAGPDAGSAVSAR